MARSGPRSQESSVISVGINRRGGHYSCYSRGLSHLFASVALLSSLRASLGLLSRGPIAGSKMQGSSCTAGSSLGLSRAVLANLLSKPAGRSIAGQHGFTSLPLNLRGSLVAQSLKLRPSLYQDLVSADALRQSGLGLTSPFYEPQR